MSNTIPIEWELSTLESNARLITDGAHASPPPTRTADPLRPFKICAPEQLMLARAD